MKIFNFRILTHRKTIFIFLLAIFLPSLIAGYLSLRTFPKRREAVRNLLESNLWISGESALRSVEGALLEYEQEVLNPEKFNSLIQPGNIYKSHYVSLLHSGDTTGQYFLLNTDFNIVIPEKADDNTTVIQFEEETGNSRFAQSFKRAENLEYSRKNYARAAELYRECASYSTSKQHHVIALDGMGRCLLSSGRYDEAYNVYSALSGNYGHFLNRAGHPYGIVAVFQLYEIAREKNEIEKGLEIMVSLYKKIREGTWTISRPVYDFYISEIESILNNGLSGGQFPVIQGTYTETREQQSPYRQTLLFTDLLERNIVPGIKEKLSFSRINDKFIQERFPLASEDKLCIVSYAVLPDFQSEKTFYGGFCWDLDYLKDHMITDIINDISRDTGLNFKLADEGDGNITSGDEVLSGEETLVLTFRTFPLPWKLLVSHPGIKAIEKVTRREIFFYGVLLSVIVALMLFGAVMIARDISREAETNRLKTEFVNNISHELKTPLTLIRLYGETLERKENLTDKEKKECYNIITKESERLSHMINNVLDFSRIETGRKEFNLKKGYLQDVISDTLESYSYHLEKKGFTIHSDIARDLPEMSFDGEAMASVLVNLLSNAIKFSPEEKEVTVKLFRDKGNAVLQVADKGIGIVPGEVSRVFQRFYRSENKPVSETRGSGLGLTLVKHIVDAHGGRIDVESEVGKGSTFTVNIPLGGN
ncbi:MAG: GHKL domain-containing protein [Bacteroidales bacterium]|nr:GHKL domain-containing protein [Bacteroidales bacterium]